MGNESIKYKKISLKYELGSFKEVFEYLDNRKYYDELSNWVLSDRRVGVDKSLSLIKEPDNEKFTKAVLSFTITEYQSFIINIIENIDSVYDGRILNSILLRYKRHVFRLIYVLWQNNYDNKSFIKIFIKVLENSKSEKYVLETGFDIKTLKKIITSKRFDQSMIERARLEGLDMSEFLTSHKIHRKSLISIDLLSIFLLFCNARDYLDFGTERLLVAVNRYEMLNQAKTLNNMLKKLDAEQRKELEDVILHLLNKYPYISDLEENNLGFWDYISPESVEILKKDFFDIFGLKQ